MLKKLKSVLAVEQNLDELNKKIKETTKATKEQNSEISELKSELKELKLHISKVAKEGDSSLDMLQKELEAISDLKDGMKKELYDLKLLKTEIKSRLIADLSDDFKSELKKSMRALDTDISSYNEMRDNLKQANAQFKDLTGEINKFKAIAKDVKQADFTMTKHAQEMSKLDKEKHELRQKIDKLETLLSKERRRGGQRY